jgi:hypothetical protein
LDIIVEKIIIHCFTFLSSLKLSSEILYIQILAIIADKDKDKENHNQSQAEIKILGVNLVVRGGWWSPPNVNWLGPQRMVGLGVANAVRGLKHNRVI